MKKMSSIFLNRKNTFTIAHGLILSIFFYCGFVTSEETKSDLPIENEESTVITLDPELYQIMLDWDGEGSISYREALIETKRFDLIEKFLDQSKESSTFISLQEYLNTFDIEIYETIVESYKKQSDSISLEVFTVADMIESNHPLFNAWQYSILEKDIMLFTDYSKKIDPDSFNEWEKNQTTPSDSQSLEDFAQKNYPEKADELLGKVRNSRPWVGGGTPRSNQCDCAIIKATFSNPSSFISYSDYSSNRTNNPLTEIEYWTEKYYAAHYAEASLIGRGREHSLEESDLKSENNVILNFKIDCQDEYTYKCSGCSASMNIYSRYSSKVQVHNDQWGLFGGASEAAVKDKVKLEIGLGNGSFQAFEKAIALSQSNKSSFKMDKVISFVSNLGGAYSKIEKDANDNVVDSNNIAKYGEIANKLYKDGKAMIEVTGKEGTTTETMHVEYNTNNQNNAPTHTLIQNKDYSLTMSTEASIIYKGKNYHKTNNSYYGSSAGLAYTLSNFQCTANVTTPAKPIGCWSHSDTYRSPLHGTTTLKDNIQSFINYNLGVSSVNASAEQSCYQL